MWHILTFSFSSIISFIRGCLPLPCAQKHHNYQNVTKCNLRFLIWFEHQKYRFIVSNARISSSLRFFCCFALFSTYSFDKAACNQKSGSAWTGEGENVTEKILLSGKMNIKEYIEDRLFEYKCFAIYINCNHEDLGMSVCRTQSSFVEGTQKSAQSCKNWLNHDSIFVIIIDILFLSFLLR